jgi:3-oxoacyl-[acyl-carrier-protein] synthase III
VFAPGFGAGAVGGYAVLRIDPAIVAPERTEAGPGVTAADTAVTPGSSSEDVRLAFA